MHVPFLALDPWAMDRRPVIRFGIYRKDGPHICGLQPVWYQPAKDPAIHGFYRHHHRGRSPCASILAVPTPNGTSTVPTPNGTCDSASAIIRTETTVEQHFCGGYLPVDHFLPNRLVEPTVHGSFELPLPVGAFVRSPVLDLP